MSGTGPVLVLRTASAIEADVVRGLLETHGIEATTSSGSPHPIFPLGGEVRLTVRADEADRARELIEEFRPAVSEELTRIRDEFRAVEEALEYRFSDPGLLEHALTHRSRAHEDASGGVLDNESLEFLGDAVLGFVVANRLFRECPDWDEGQKSKAKAMLVSTTMLARIGDGLGLGDHLLLGRGEEKTGGRRKRSLIADTFEAVVAAVYLDGGVEAAEAFIERWFREALDAVRGGAVARAGAGLQQDYKSALQEALQARELGLPRYRLVEETGPAHRKVFESEVAVGEQPLGRGAGPNKKESEQRAAQQALERLRTETSPS